MSCSFSSFEISPGAGNRLGFPSVEITAEPAVSQAAQPSFEFHGGHSLEAPNPAIDTCTTAALPEGQEIVGRNQPSSEIATSNPTPVADLQTASPVETDSTCSRTPTQSRPQRQPTDERKPTTQIEESFIDWLATQAGAKDRRKQKVLENTSCADRRHSDLRTRKVRVNRVSREEVLVYLRGFYSRDGQLHCQMRSENEIDLHVMPFWKSREQMYEGKEELFNRQMAQQVPFCLPEAKELNLYLCPNCAAIFTKFVAAIPDQQKRLLEWVRSDGSETAFSLNCSLSGRQPNRFLHFHPKHLDDIRSVDGVHTKSDALSGGE